MADPTFPTAALPSPLPTSAPRSSLPTSTPSSARRLVGALLSQLPDSSLTHTSQVASKINAAYPDTALFVKCDVSKEDEIEAAIATTVAKFGRIDYAINSAGIVVSGGTVTLIKDTPTADYERTQMIDTRGVFLCMKHQIRQMEKQAVPDRPRASRGVIVNLASKASLEGVAKFGSYCTAKHGVLGMSRVAAIECAPQNIRVVAMCPGLVKTPGHVEGAKEVDDFLLTTVPMGRFGVVDEITDGLTFLCSDMASFLTGTAFEIDGGCAAR